MAKFGELIADSSMNDRFISPNLDDSSKIQKMVKETADRTADLHLFHGFPAGTPRRNKSTTGVDYSPDKKDEPKGIKH